MLCPRMQASRGAVAGSHRGHGNVWRGGDRMVDPTDVCRFLATVRVATTEQVGRLCAHGHLSATKRGSEVLRTLADQSLVESHKLSTGVKLWRLSHMGRQQMGVTYGAPVLGTRKDAHRCAITDWYVTLALIEPPLVWQTEYREAIDDARIFSPDVFLVWRNRAYFAEIQRSPLTTLRWREKWRMYHAYYEGIERRTFQRLSQPVRPDVVIVSTQCATTIAPPHGLTVQILPPGGVPDVDARHVHPCASDVVRRQMCAGTAHPL